MIIFLYIFCIFVQKNVQIYHQEYMRLRVGLTDSMGDLQKKKMQENDTKHINFFKKWFVPRSDVISVSS
jgi:hypothetical protein